MLLLLLLLPLPLLLLMLLAMGGVTSFEEGCEEDEDELDDELRTSG